MSPSAEPPRFFVDRSLGERIVPGLLRDAGFVVETMRERYGEKRAQQISDVEWLAEQAAVRAHGVRCFCVSRGHLTGVETAETLVAARDRIVRACALPGPFIIQVNVTGLTRVL